MDYVTGVIGETIDSTAGYLKVQAAKALSSLGETAVKQSTSISGTTSSTVPGPTGPTFQTPPPPAAILITPGTPFVVAVNHDATYSISWGDGLTDSGLSPSGDSVFVSHSWNTEGDYSVKVTMKNGDGAVSQVFPVRVYR